MTDGTKANSAEVHIIAYDRRDYVGPHVVSEGKLVPCDGEGNPMSHRAWAEQQFEKNDLVCPDYLLSLLGQDGHLCPSVSPLKWAAYIQRNMGTELFRNQQAKLTSLIAQNEAAGVRSNQSLRIKPMEMAATQG